MMRLVILSARCSGVTLYQPSSFNQIPSSNFVKSWFRFSKNLVKFFQFTSCLGYEASCSRRETHDCRFAGGGFVVVYCLTPVGGDSSPRAVVFKYSTSIALVVNG